MPSKNIVDLLLIVPKGMELTIVETLSSHGLEAIPVPEVSTTAMLRLRDECGNPILHLHIDHTADRPDVLFHSRLRQDSELVRAYGQMKKEAQEKSGGDIMVYNQLKSEFFNNLSF